MKENDILLGASKKNQLRFHLGYHYPRSVKTVDEIKKNYNQFTNLLESLNLPVQNEDFQQYIIELQKVAFHKVSVIVAFLFICSYYLVKSDFKYFKN